MKYIVRLNISHQLPILCWQNNSANICESEKSYTRKKNSNDFGSGRGHLLHSIPTLPLLPLCLIASILFQWDGIEHTQAQNSTNHMNMKKDYALSSSQHLATLKCGTIETNRLYVEFLRTYLRINSLSQ